MSCKHAPILLRKVSTVPQAAAQIVELLKKKFLLPQLLDTPQTTIVSIPPPPFH